MRDNKKSLIVLSLFAISLIASLTGCNTDTADPAIYDAAQKARAEQRPGGGGGQAPAGAPTAGNVNGPGATR